MILYPYKINAFLNPKSLREQIIPDLVIRKLVIISSLFPRPSRRLWPHRHRPQRVVVARVHGLDPRAVRRVVLLVKHGGRELAGAGRGLPGGGRRRTRDLSNMDKT